MDCIHLTGIRAYGYTGYLPEEQVLGQWFEVDVTLWMDLTPSAKSDRIEHTVDYRNVITIVKEILITSKFALVEKLAETIAQTILDIELIKQVRVKLIKPGAPIPDFGGKIIIDITRGSLTS